MMESWVKVAAAPDETDALLMDGVLKDAGIPSLIQRAAGFDAPDFLAADAAGGTLASVEHDEVFVNEAPSAGPLGTVTGTVGGVTDTVSGATDNLLGGKEKKN